MKQIKSEPKPQISPLDVYHIIQLPSIELLLAQINTHRNLLDLQLKKAGNRLTEALISPKEYSRPKANPHYQTKYANQMQGLFTYRGPAQHPGLDGYEREGSPSLRMPLRYQSQVLAPVMMNSGDLRYSPDRATYTQPDENHHRYIEQNNHLFEQSTPKLPKIKRFPS